MLTVTPTGAALGADIEGIDLRRIDDATFAKILDAWHDHLVIRFRGQQLDDDALAEFSRRFGVLDMAPTGRGGTPFNQSRPEITVLSNIVVDGAFKGALGNSELVWHQDMSYNDEPPKASLLYALEVPGEGGDTLFYNLYKAYETLPADLKTRIQGVSCKHDATRSSSGELRHGYAETYSDAARPGAVAPAGGGAAVLARRRGPRDHASVVDRLAALQGVRVVVSTFVVGVTRATAWATGMRAGTSGRGRRGCRPWHAGRWSVGFLPRGASQR